MLANEIAREAVAFVAKGIVRNFKFDEVVMCKWLGKIYSIYGGEMFLFFFLGFS